MTAIQLNAKKLEIIDLVMNTDDEKILAGLLNVFRKSGKAAPPCQFTVEEMREQIDLSMEDYRTSGVAFSMEEMRAKHPRI